MKDRIFEYMKIYKRDYWHAVRHKELMNTEEKRWALWLAGIENWCERQKKKKAEVPE